MWKTEICPGCGRQLDSREGKIVPDCDDGRTLYYHLACLEPILKERVGEPLMLGEQHVHHNQ